MTSNEIKYFVQHYEKITKWMMKDLNKKAQIVIKFEKNHKISSLNFNQKKIHLLTELQYLSNSSPNLSFKYFSSSYITKLFNQKNNPIEQIKYIMFSKVRNIPK